MNTIYKVGVIIGILAIYSLVTLGIGAFILAKDNCNEEQCLAIAWFVGALAFLVLAVFTLEKFGLWMG